MIEKYFWFHYRENVCKKQSEKHTISPHRYHMVVQGPMLVLLSALATAGDVSSLQTFKGFQRLVDQLDDLALDMPQLQASFHTLCADAVAAGTHPSVYYRVPFSLCHSQQFTPYNDVCSDYMLLKTVRWPVRAPAFFPCLFAYFVFFS